jgi:anti-sigma factor RsiW
MNRTCEQIDDQLVGYADGELPEIESAAVAEHLAICAECRKTVAALKKSIAAAGIIWQDAQSDLAHVHITQRRRYRLLRPALVAASILLLLTGSLVWHLLPSGHNSSLSQTMTLAELERTVTRAGVATHLLAAADYLGEQPGGAELAVERYRYILTVYPETKAATEARLRLEHYSQRRT